jgi:hypothetical protein
MTKTHVDRLLEARERAVADRRALAAEIAKPYERGREQLHQRFVELQAAIDAIDRAITDERCIAEKGKPMPLVTPIVAGPARPSPAPAALDEEEGGNIGPGWPLRP